MQASASGDAITFFSQSGLPGGSGAGDFPTFLASRGSEAWSSQGLLPPATLGEGGDVLGSAPDLSQTYDESRVFTANGTATSFLRRNSSDGSFETIVPYTLGVENYAFSGASADGWSCLFEEAGAQLTPNAAPGRENLYIWDRDTDTVRLAGVLPDGGAPSGELRCLYQWIEGETDKGGIGAREGGRVCKATPKTRARRTARRCSSPLPAASST